MIGHINATQLPDNNHSAQPHVRFNRKNYATYPTVGEKIDAILQNSKKESNPEMMEKFYFRLLPVTYREWMSK